MSEPLTATQEEHAREIATQEVRNFGRLLADEIANTPMRADGNINGRDLWQAFNAALKRLDEGEVA